LVYSRSPPGLQGRHAETPILYEVTIAVNGNSQGNRESKYGKWRRSSGTRQVGSLQMPMGWGRKRRRFSQIQEGEPTEKRGPRCWGVCASCFRFSHTAPGEEKRRFRGPNRGTAYSIRTEICELFPEIKAQRRGGSGGNVGALSEVWVWSFRTSRPCGGSPEAVHRRKNRRPAMGGTLRVSTRRQSRGRGPLRTSRLRPTMGGRKSFRPSTRSPVAQRPCGSRAGHEPPPENVPNGSGVRSVGCPGGEKAPVTPTEPPLLRLSHALLLLSCCWSRRRLPRCARNDMSGKGAPRAAREVQRHCGRSTEEPDEPRTRFEQANDR
jgi:hypothetical protein